MKFARLGRHRWRKHKHRGWELVDPNGEAVGRITPYRYGSGWKISVYGIPAHTNHERAYPGLAKTKALALDIIVAARGGFCDPSLGIPRDTERRS